jgi:hypothetical protein
MKQSIKVFQNSRSILQGLEWNPQLFRELKGRLKPKNIIITAAISTIAQSAIALYFLGQLPEPISDPLAVSSQYSHYCYGNVYLSSTVCTTDLLNHWVINWQLLWLDLFITLSTISIFALLVIGTYMLIVDTVKEETRGTLNFIRLTPQSGASILLGKILGVPILLYVGISLMFPLHLVAGLGARIPLDLIIGFDLAVVASCALFYSAALLWSLTDNGLAGFKPWFASGAVLLFLSIACVSLSDRFGGLDNNTLDGLLLFYPGTMLSYLIERTFLPEEKIAFLTASQLGELRFYGQQLLASTKVGMGFVLLNYGLWTYWLWSVLKRRFHNPQSTLISKTQSYGLTACFVIISLGFCLQTDDYHVLTDNFRILQCLLLIFFLGAIAALSPHRQALYDWSRYRHQVKGQDNLLWKEMVFGENSPSTVAIAINLLFTTAYITPSLFFFCLKDQTWGVFWGLLLGANIILLYAVVAQSILTAKSQKRAIWATATITSLVVAPPLCLGLAEIIPAYSPLPWLFTFLPAGATEYATLPAIALAILGQWLAIAVMSWQMTAKLRQAGASETKMLLSKVE